MPTYTQGYARLILDEVKAQRIAPGLCEVTVKLKAASGEADQVCAQIKEMLIGETPEIEAEVIAPAAAAGAVQTQRRIPLPIQADRPARPGE